MLQFFNIIMLPQIHTQFHKKEFISYGNYRMKKDYNRCCHSLLRIEEVPLLFVFVCRPYALSNLRRKDSGYYFGVTGVVLAVG